ncbi:MAG: BatA domain-containing protein, partial [Planctomycetota bacterium]|nr:BatA domain-containing protein [Planctomycetota bacterium]
MTFDWLNALWLWPLALLVLALLRFLRARRREVVAGSLLIWRRVAAQETRKPRSLFEIDRSLLLQAAALTLLTWALAGPALAVFQTPGRRLALLLDNGPAARARTSDGARVWDGMLAQARTVLEQAGPADRVWLAVSSPSPAQSGSPEGMTRAEALQQLEELRPALSGPETGPAWLFLLEMLKDGGAEATARVAISPRSPPAEAARPRPGAHWIAAGPADAPANVALTGFGSVLVTNADGTPAAELLAQVRNFSAQAVKGSVTIEPLEKAADLAVDARARDLSLAPGETAAAVFRLAREKAPAVRIAWQPSGGTPDALPEDDVLCAAPRALRPPRVRFHGRAPHLEALYRSSGLVDVLDNPAAEGTQDSKEEKTAQDEADLEIYVDTMPAGELPAAAKAVLLLAPPRDYGPFEVTGKRFETPASKLGEADALTRGAAETPGGLGFPILKAREMRALGDWRVFLKDAEGHALGARFRLRGGRAGFVFGFLPGDGMPAERKLEPPAFPTIFLRLALEAAGSGGPYAAVPAAELERRHNLPLALDWTPGLDEKSGAGTGVLNAAASDLAAARGAPGGEAA